MPTRGRGLRRRVGGGDALHDGLHICFLLSRRKESWDGRSHMVSGSQRILSMRFKDALRESSAHGRQNGY